MKKIISKILLLSLILSCTSTYSQGWYGKMRTVLTSPTTWKTIAAIGLFCAVRLILKHADTMRENNEPMPVPVPQSEPQSEVKCDPENHSFYACPVCLEKLSKLLSSAKAV